MEDRERIFKLTGTEHSVKNESLGREGRPHEKYRGKKK